MPPTNWREPSSVLPETLLSLLRGTQCPIPLFDVVTSLCDLTDIIWGKGSVLYDFTDHGPRHSRRIIQYLRQLDEFLPGAGRLSAAEWFVLVAAALIHDAGMQWPVILRELAPGAPQEAREESWSDVRRAHATRSAELLDSVVRARAPLGEAYPALSTFRTPTLSSWERLLRWILTVITAHTRDRDGHETAWRDATAFADFWPTEGDELAPLGHFRMRLVAALFRLADELDVTHLRVPNLQRLLAQRPNVPWGSLTFWASCYFVDQVRIQHSRFRLSIDRTKLPLNDSRLREVGDFLVLNLVHDKLRRAFLKPIARGTSSIQQILLSYDLPLLIDEPEFSGGGLTRPVDDGTRTFLEGVLAELSAAPFSGTVPISAYAIRGCAEDPSSRTGREVRRVRLVDETRAIRVPEALRPSFLHTQTLQASRAIAFLRPGSGCEAEVLAYSERGPRTATAVSAVFAAAAHLNLPDVTLLSAGARCSVRAAGSHLRLEVGRPSRPKLGRRIAARASVRSLHAPWAEITTSYSPTDSVVIHAVELRGLHFLLWPPDNDCNPVLRTFLDRPAFPPAAPPGRSLWMQRVQLLESIAAQILRALGITPVTISIMQETPPHCLLTYSSDSGSCVTFSGAAMAAAGCFAFSVPGPTLLPVTRSADDASVPLTAWYEPSQQFQVHRLPDGTITLACQVKRLLEGRLFL